MAGGNKLPVLHFFPSLHKFKKRFLLKSCVAMTTPGSTWTFLKPWANQHVFLMEMFALSYTNELCIYLDSAFKSFCQRLRTDLTNQYVLLMQMFSQAMLMRLYLLGNLSSRFMSIILWPQTTHLVPMLPQNACCGWGAWCQSLSFETFPFSN